MSIRALIERSKAARRLNNRPPSEGLESRSDKDVSSTSP